MSPTKRAIAKISLGTVCVLFLMAVFFWLDGRSVSAAQRFIICLIGSLCAGLLAYLMAGDLRIVTQGDLSAFGRIGIQAGGGLAAFVLTLVFCDASFGAKELPTPVVNRTIVKRDIGNITVEYEPLQLPSGYSVEVQVGRDRQFITVVIKWQVDDPLRGTTTYGGPEVGQAQFVRLAIRDSAGRVVRRGEPKRVETAEE